MLGLRVLKQSPQTIVPVRNLLSKNVPVEFLSQRQGPGGRSSVSGVVATVFGATGFLGRYVISMLGKIGTQVIVPYRGDEYELRHLRVMGDLGQIVPLKYNPEDPQSIANMMERSTVCINLAGKQYQTISSTFEKSNVDIVRSIAEAAKKAGVDRFVHVSALAADAKSPSQWAQAKAKGEAAVRDIYPDAVVLKPAHIFGHEDRFFNRFAIIARLTNHIFIVGDGNAKVQPIYVQDVAEAVATAAMSSNAPGQTYHLAGPEVWTLRQAAQFCRDHLNWEISIDEVPFLAGNILGRIGEYLPNAPATRDDYLLLQQNVVLPKGVKTLEDLGITPTRIEEKVPEYMVKYRRGSHFSELPSEQEPFLRP